MQENPLKNADGKAPETTSGDAREGRKESVTDAAMQLAAGRTWDAVRRIAAQIVPGMDDKAATRLALQTLASLGSTRFWHKPIVRFGEHTLLGYEDNPAEPCVLGQDDIFFIDIGPTWDGIEGDSGDTFVVGSDAEMQKAQTDVRRLFQAVKTRWQEEALAGPALYAFAEAEAQAMGWQLHPPYVKGHRIAEFPHSFYKGGDLGEFTGVPQPNRWILEIQIRHPSRPFGAFFEDLL